MNLALIGYRATGKSTVAQILSKTLGWPWVDTDVEIENRARRSIATIFRDEGEDAFRDLETRVVLELASRDRWIFALGGGAVMRSQNRTVLRTTSSFVWLKASPETIHRRMAADALSAARRPSLSDRGPLEEIRHLLREREPIYRQCASTEIDTEGKSPRDVAQEILSALGMAHWAARRPE